VYFKHLKWRIQGHKGTISDKNRHVTC